MQKPSAKIDWQRIRGTANRLTGPGTGPGAVLDSEWRLIEDTLTDFLETGDLNGVITLRRELDPLFARDTVTGLKIMQQLDMEAISAARRLDQAENLGYLLGTKGHNLHRQGYHQQSINAFCEAATLYQTINNPWEAMKNRFMTVLCFRALGDREQAMRILGDVLNEVDRDDPWYGQPLQVKAWLVQDKGNLPETEELLRAAVRLHKKGNDSDILVAGALADLAEVVGLQNRVSEANGLFFQSLTILEAHQGQNNRQVAQTKIKLAELLMRQRNYGDCLNLLDEADDLISAYGHYYDLMWRIELLRALVFLRQGHLRKAYLKFRATRRFRNELELSNFSLFRKLVSGLRSGVRLPR